MQTLGLKRVVSHDAVVWEPKGIKWGLLVAKAGRAAHHLRVIPQRKAHKGFPIKSIAVELKIFIEWEGTALDPNSASQHRCGWLSCSRPDGEVRW